MRRHESQAAKTITPTEPLTPGQQRVASLQSNAKRATKVAMAESAGGQQGARQLLATV